MHGNYSIREDGMIDRATQVKWQKILDLIAELMEIPVALIMRVHESDIEVYARSGNPDNLFKMGDRSALGGGLYCETVMRTRAMLLVPDARRDEKWRNNPDMALGLIAYLGFPIAWPTGEIFGTICVLDKKVRGFSDLNIKLLSQYADIVQDDLARLLVQSDLRKALAEHTQSIQSLRDSEERFAKAFRASGAGILITSFKDGVIIDANETYQRLLGYSREELIGRTAAALDIYIDPKDRAHALEILMRGEAVRDYEMPLRAKSGEVKTVSGTVLRIEIAGKDCLITSLNDLTAIKILQRDLTNLNERYALAIRAAQAGVWDWDAVNDVLQWDDQMYRLYEARKDEFAGAYEAWQARLHPEDRDASQAETQKALNGEKEYDVEFRILLPGGRVRHIKAYGDVIRDPQGEPVRMVGINLDITERKRLEKELQHSVRLYRELFDQNSAVRLVVDVDTGAIINANPAACKFYGYARNELLSKNMTDINGLPIDVIKHNLKLAYAQKQNHFVTRQYLADGAIREVEVFNGPMEIQGRKYVNCIIHDITERKRIERQLMVSEARYRNIFYNNYAVQILVNALDGSIVDANKAACAYYGFTIEEIKKKKLVDINPTGPDHIQEKMRQTLETGSNHIITQHLRGDHTLRDVEIFNGRIVLEGQTLIHAIVHDITDSKQAMLDLTESEQRFRLFVENAPDGIVVQVDSRFAYVNRRTVELFRAASDRDLIGKFIPDFVVEEQGRLVSDRIRRMEEDRSSLTLSQETIVRLDGTRVDVEVSAVPFTYYGKSGALVYLRDITERKEFENAKLEMEMQLRQKQKLESIGTLAGGVAHEINNPINGIINYAELISEGTLPPEQTTEYSLGIMREGRRIAEIVKNLLSFARQEKQSHSPARIEDIIDKTVSLLRVMLRHDDIQLEVNIPDGLPSIKCRSQQIQQVLMNLLGNARDALNAKYKGFHDHKKIRIDCQMFEGEGRRWLKITVTDNGTGIPAHVLDRVFDPFFTTKSRDEGTGLGLSISHGIVKDHHGALYFETEEGQYTKAILVLPVDNGWSVQ